LGQWTSRDPVDRTETGDHYQFELSAPTSNLDPRGTAVIAKFFTMEWTPGFDFADLDAQMANGGTPYADAGKFVVAAENRFFHNSFNVPNVSHAGLYTASNNAGGPPGAFVLAFQVVTLTWFICDPNDEVKLSFHEHQTLSDGAGKVAQQDTNSMPGKTDTWWVSGLKASWAKGCLNKLLVFVDAPAVTAQPKAVPNLRQQPFAQAATTDETIELLDGNNNVVGRYNFRLSIGFDPFHMAQSQVVRGA
jgi:hypothetical protein